MLSALVASLAGDIKFTVPWDAIRAIPADILTALTGGDSAPLRAHIATVLDDAVDLSALPFVGAMAEAEQSKLAVAMVDHIVAKIETGALPALPHAGAAQIFAVDVIDSAEDAAAVLAHKERGVWRMFHPHLVAAALAYGA